MKFPHSSSSYGKSCCKPYLPCRQSYRSSFRWWSGRVIQRDPKRRSVKNVFIQFYPKCRNFMNFKNKSSEKPWCSSKSRTYKNYEATFEKEAPWLSGGQHWCWPDRVLLRSASWCYELITAWLRTASTAKTGKCPLIQWAFGFSSNGFTESAWCEFRPIHGCFMLTVEF